MPSSIAASVPPGAFPAGVPNTVTRAQPRVTSYTRKQSNDASKLRLPFCRIVADTRQCELLAEDPAALAFMDIHPANPGHCLVISKGHWSTIFEISAEEFAAVARLAARVAAAVNTALRPPGVSLAQANGTAAGQSVPHLHVHVLPRRDDDALLLNWPRTGAGDQWQIAATAAPIRTHLLPVIATSEAVPGRDPGKRSPASVHTGA